MKSFSFTQPYQGLARELKTQCHISEAWDVASGGQHPPIQEFTCLWDTGATGSVISQGVVDACGLQSVGTRDVYHVKGVSRNTPVFLVNILLPNSVGCAGIPVTLGDMKGFDVLIGMDIILRGDFAVTNRDGKTKMSFSIPSQEDIDFSVRDKRANVVGKQSLPSQSAREKGRRKRKDKK